MKFLILSILILLTLGCSTTPKPSEKAYFSEEVQFNYATTTIAYSSEEEREAVLGFVKRF